MKFQSITICAGLTLLGLLAAGSAMANSKAELKASAASSLAAFYALNPANKELLDKAAGVLIFSHVTKGGAGVAGEYGEGILRRNGLVTRYYSLSSASIGLTLGVGERSEIIMFMTNGALDQFMRSDGWSVGADTAVAVVSQGSGNQYDTATIGKPILGFVFAEKGLIGDLSFEGSKITRIKVTS
jgi:lipid-binding SYLF domain-containing protein